MRERRDRRTTLISTYLRGSLNIYFLDSFSYRVLQIFGPDFKLFPSFSLFGNNLLVVHAT